MRVLKSCLILISWALLLMGCDKVLNGWVGSSSVLFEVGGTTTLTNVSILASNDFSLTVTNKHPSKTMPYTIVPPNSDFSVLSSGCGSTGSLAAGASCTLNLRWTPYLIYSSKVLTGQIVTDSGSTDFSVNVTTKECFYHLPNAKVDMTDNNAGLKRQLWLTCVDGSINRPITTQINTAWGTFFISNDGKTIYYLSDGALDGSDSAGAARNIWKLDLTTLTKTPLTNFTAGYQRDMNVDVNAGYIFYISSRKLDGSDTAYSPLFSAFQAVNIWRIKLDGSGITPLTNYTGANINTSVSSFTVEPTQKKILFAANYKLDGVTDSPEGAFGWGNHNLWIVNYDGTQKTHITNYSAYAPVIYGYYRLLPDNSITYGIQAKLDGTDAGGNGINTWKATGYPGPSFSTTPVTDYSGPATGYQLPINAFAGVPAQTSDTFYFYSNRTLSGTQALQSGGASYFNIFKTTLSNPTVITPVTNFTNINVFPLTYYGYFSEDGLYYYGSFRCPPNGSDSLHPVNNLFKINLQTGAMTAITNYSLADPGFSIKRVPKAQ